MQLKPTHPPGRRTRKVRAYGEEIFRLLREGHTSDAIREALEREGISVSRSTVQREGARVARRHAAASPASPASPARKPSPDSPTVRKPGQAAMQLGANGFSGDNRSGRQIAEAFMSGHLDNPLIRERNEHEARRD